MRDRAASLGLGANPFYRPAGFAAIAADLAVLFTAGAVIGLFAISSVTLEYFGFAYITSGGGALTKFHPSTPMAFAAIVCRCLATPRPLSTAWRMLTRDAGVVLLLIMVAVLAVYTVAISKTPFTPLFDTFLLPVVCFLLLRGLDPRILRWIAYGVIVVMVANAAIGFFEFVTKKHIFVPSFGDDVSSDPTRTDKVFDWRAEIALDWRAVALLGHPLSNAMIVCCFVACLAAPGARWLKPHVRFPLLLLQTMSLFVFGGRSGMVLAFASLAYFGTTSGLEAIRRGARIGPRGIAFALLSVMIFAIGAAVVLESGIADRMLERFVSDDGSAKTRLVMLNLFQPLSWTQILLGPDQDVVATAQRIDGLEFGIESSWIGLALTYGVVLTAFLVAALLAFCRTVIRNAGRGGTIVFADYLLIVSGMAAISGKSTSLAMVVCLVLLFLRPDHESLSGRRRMKQSVNPFLYRPRRSRPSANGAYP